MRIHTDVYQMDVLQTKLHVRRAAACAILLCGVLLSAGCGRYSFMNEISQSVRSAVNPQDEVGKREEEAKAAYEKYPMPENFTAEAAAAIGRLEPAAEDWEPRDEYEPRQDVEAPENPYEVTVSDPDHFTMCAEDLLNAWLGYYQNLNGGYRDAPEEYRYQYAEVVGSTLLAGDQEDFAVDVIAKIHVEDAENSFYSQFGTPGDKGNITCQLTIHACHEKEYTFRLLGIVYTEEARKALGLSDDYVKADPKAHSDCGYRNIEGVLSVSYDGGENYAAVPLSQEDLFDRGDGNGAKPSATLESGSYYITPEKTAFIYGGGTRDVRAMISNDSGATWKESVIASSNSVRRSFIGFAGDRFGYALVCGDRTMGSDMSTLYISKDGGKTWRMAGSPFDGGSFLVLGCVFISEEVGFITVTSSQEPTLYRTGDGGSSWENIPLMLTREYQTMAYGPEVTSEGLALYVNEDCYGEMQGEMTKLVSSDDGLTWKEAGIVRR